MGGDRDPTAHLREARTQDLPAVLRLYGQLHPDDAVPNREALDAVFARIAATEGLTLFVLEGDGAVLATAYLNVIPNLTRGAAPYAVIENVVVEEARRGTGLGKRLLIATLQAAWDAGCYKAMLLTGSTNPATHAFYRACGFSADAKTAYVARPGASRS